MFKWLTNRGDDAHFDPATLGMPWGTRQPLYLYIANHVDATTGCLVAPQCDLPDASARADNKVRWSAGSLDGILSHGLGRTEAQDVARVIHGLLLRVISRRDTRAFGNLYAFLLEHTTLSYVDHLNTLVTSAIDDSGDKLLAIGRYLLHYAADREVVKFAINIVGVCGDSTDHPALSTVGLHEEFTLFAAVALVHSGGDSRCIWELAKRVDGWGRIQCIARLDNDKLDPDIRAWMLTDGYKNEVMTEYTAAICARRGNLLDSLRCAAPDRGLIDGAAEILAALAREEPGEGMAGYSESAQSTERFLRIVAAHESPSISWLLAVRDIEQYIQRTSGKEASGGWTHDAIDRCAGLANRVRCSAVWHRLVQQLLECSDEYRFNMAADAAQHIGIDAWEHRYNRLRSGSDQWYWLLETADINRIERVLNFAGSAIDLRSVTTGYGNELGMDSSFVEHRKLGWILQALQRWPGYGATFIRAGFRSPVVQNRWCSARAVLRWSPASREPFLDIVRQLHQMEENTELKSALARILSGEFEPSDSVQ